MAIKLPAKALNIENEEVFKIAPEDMDMAFRVEELRSKRLEYSLKEEELKGQQQDRDERKDYATKVYVLLVIFLLIVFAIVVLVGIISFPFHLSDNVLITILTTASANLIGIFAIVIRYLFKDKSR
jgi:hypothetical protein